MGPGDQGLGLHAATVSTGSTRVTEVDYIVVGAGSAGCVLANRLSADPAAQVLLLEAGGGDDHPLVRMPVGFMKALQQPGLTWGFESEPEAQLNGRRLPIPRGRLLGGSSSINGMFHIRGHRRDFDDWAALGNPGWAYADVLPYFQRSEQHWRGAGPFHGGDGPVQLRPIDTTELLAEPLRAAALAAGHAANPDYDGAQSDGFARGDVAIDARGRRSSSARAYLHPVRQRPNLQVFTRALSRRVLIEAGRAVGVEFSRGRSAHGARSACAAAPTARRSC
jgi:choline dehydrogenase